MHVGPHRKGVCAIAANQAHLDGRRALAVNDKAVFAAQAVQPQLVRYGRIEGALVNKVAGRFVLFNFGDGNQ